LLAHHGSRTDASADSLGAFISSATAKGAVVHTDGWSGYAGLRGLGYEHRPRSQRAEPAEQLLPRAHRAISNFKAWMDGTHRGVSDKHLHVYLDEYVRHEALSDRVGCKAPPPGCRSGPVKLRAA
jgi:hypothetical protein